MFEVMHLADAKAVEHPFGRIYEMLGDERFNVARAVITDDERHYHERATEVYYVISGIGHMELNGTTVDLRPNTVIRIDPRTRHRAYATEGKLDVIVFSFPPYDPKDGFKD